MKLPGADCKEDESWRDNSSGCSESEEEEDNITLHCNLNIKFNLKVNFGTQESNDLDQNLTSIQCSWVVALNLILDPVYGFGPFQDHRLEDSRGQITLSNTYLPLQENYREEAFSSSDRRDLHLQATRSAEEIDTSSFRQNRQRSCAWSGSPLLRTST